MEQEPTSETKLLALARCFEPSAIIASMIMAHIFIHNGGATSDDGIIEAETCKLLDYTYAVIKASR